MEEEEVEPLAFSYKQNMLQESFFLTVYDTLWFCEV